MTSDRPNYDLEAFARNRANSSPWRGPTGIPWSKDWGRRDAAGGLLRHARGAAAGRHQGLTPMPDADTIPAWRASTWQTATRRAWCQRIDAGRGRVQCPGCQRAVQRDQGWVLRPHAEGPAVPWHAVCAGAD